MGTGGDTAWDFAEFQAEFTPVEMTAMVCSDGKLTADIERAELELASLGEDDSSRPELARRIVAMVDDLRTKERPFLVRAISDLAWSNLLAEHAPGEDDMAYGYNQRTFPQAAVAASCVAPDLTLEQAEWLRSTLAPSQWRRLWSAARVVNELGDGLGKLPSGTATRLASETKSTTRRRSASHGASSSAES
ncbi:MAG: hypothetical protein JWN67_5041 [Actinomycetia bacterium]|nr:hypothetical protein [Actinomycetes bacterium]